MIDIEREGLVIDIIKSDRKDFSNFTNSYASSHMLYIKAECISLKKIIGILTGTKVSSVIMNKNLEKQYFNVLIDQCIMNAGQDSIMRSDVIKALALNVSDKDFNFDSTLVSIDKRRSFLKYSNRELNDTIRSRHILLNDYIVFENMALKDVLKQLSEMFGKVFILKSEEVQKISFKIERNDWSSVKKKLESILGLAFTEYRFKGQEFGVMD